MPSLRRLAQMGSAHAALDLEAEQPFKGHVRTRSNV